MGCTESREQVTCPRPLSSLSRHEWLTWRKCFRAYMDHKGIPHCQRGEKFLKYIGFLGEELSKKFYFAYTAHETKYEVLDFKFDVYFIYSSNENFIKADNQSYEEYISLLKNIAEKMDKPIDVTVKEKLLQDFKSKNLFNRIKKLDLNCCISNYENLAIHELLFLWKECDNLESIQANNCCKRCNLHHPFGKCFARGKICWKCGESNHFARCCSNKFINKCTSCGSNHEINKCSASNKQCSKCKRLNHFSWMCNTDMVKDCIYLAGTHRSGCNHCFAGHSTCVICSKKGHYTSHCFHRKYK
ncbi:uncharacterized protein LOC131671977 [Phymastichus coffea]|uniref:uncharacterized protein LOC131671977 n=1 Tax=Phymastichus coffea TaxID=108790 RepID=UPI00273C7B52|nr:uncharacterized protein LOC131671977 [Phymastichus coffea]